MRKPCQSLESHQNCRTWGQGFTHLTQALTCQVFQDGSHVHGCPHSNPVLGVAFLDVSQHAPHRKDDSRLGGPGGFGGLLLSAPARHGGGPDCVPSAAGSASTLWRQEAQPSGPARTARPPFALTLASGRNTPASRCHCLQLLSPLSPGDTLCWSAVAPEERMTWLFMFYTMTSILSTISI